MKIACTFQYIQISDNYYIDKEDSYRSATEKLVKEGHEVHYFVMSETLNCVRGPINGVYYHHGSRVEHLMIEIRNYEPDFIIMSGFGPSMNTQCCHEFPRAKKLLLFVGGEIKLPKEEVDWIMISSEEMKKELVLKGYPAEKVIVCSFGVNVELFKPSDHGKMFDIIYCADWRENKRQELLLKAVALMPGVKCLIIGAQTGRYNKVYFKEMLELARKLRITDRLYCINRIPGKCLPIWYQSSKMGIHLGLPTEGGARSPLEAMACGLPVIVTTDCMSNTSRITHMQEGLHSKAEPEALVEAISRLSRDDTLRKRLGGQARKRVEREYHEDRMLEVFTDCLNGAKEPMIEMNEIKLRSEKKKVYLFGHFGAGMLADEIIREATERLIKSINLDVTTDSWLSHPFPLYPCPDYNIAPDEDAGAINKVIDKLNSEYDLIVFCGGTWLGRLKVQLEHSVRKWHGKLKIPYIIFGAGYRDEIESLSKEEKEGVELFFNGAYKIGLRGNITPESLRDLGFNTKNMEVIGDSIFSLTFSDQEVAESLRHRKTRPFIGTNVRIMGDIERRQVNNVDDWTAWEWFAMALTALVQQKSLNNIVSFPLTVPTKTIYSDQKAFHALRYSLDPYINAESCYINLIPMARAVGEATFNFGTRLHFQMMSLVNGVPFMPIEYEFNKLADALSIHSAFEPFAKNIVSMAEGAKLPTASEVLERYDALYNVNREGLKQAVEEIRVRQFNWMRKVLEEVL